MVEKMSIVRWESGEHSRRDDFLSVEEPLAVDVNGQRVAVLMRLPGGEKELAAGFLVSEGFVSRFDDIRMLSHCGETGENTSGESLGPSRNVVTVRSDSLNRPQDAATLLIRAGCGRTSVEDLGENIPRVTGELGLPVRTLTAMARQILDEQDVRQMAGGVHLAALFDREGRLLVTYEDIGRHNAADKVLGYALIRDIPLEDKILYNTGRASYELVIKAARLGVPVLASKSSPTSLAVTMARQANVTLCGFVRPNRANVYSGAERILFEHS